MKKVSDIIQQFRSELIDVWPLEEVNQFIFLAFNFKVQFSRTDLMLKSDEVISDEDGGWFQEVISRLRSQEPIQYILGETEFYHSMFRINHNVLIPRPETEELVHWIVSNHANEAMNILDIGTGSGCIALSIKKSISKAEVFAYDVSKEALKLAWKNAQINRLNVHFKEINILEVSELDKKFDIIVSNPPYVLKSEKAMMEKNVLHHEPHLALFVEDGDALIFYRKITELASKALTKKGKIYFEINEKKGDGVKRLLEEYGFENIELKKDLQGKERMILGQKL